jgi:hypothetical protein
MNQTIVTLKKGEGRSFKAGGLWIYDNEIEKIEGTFKNGAVVTVHDNTGYPLGRGFINQNSKIRVRMMTRDASEEINEAFLEKRVRAAWEYRKKTVDTASCRVIFGEAEAPVHAPDPAMAERRLGFYKRCGLRIAGYDTELFGVHYNTLYLADWVVDDDTLLEEHRFVYRNTFTDEKYAKYVRIPYDPATPQRARVDWVQ